MEGARYGGVCARRVRMYVSAVRERVLEERMCVSVGVVLACVHAVSSACRVVRCNGQRRR